MLVQGISIDALGRLVTLYDMLDLHGSNFYEMARIIGLARSSTLVSFCGLTDETLKSVLEELKEGLTRMSEHCQKTGLTVSKPEVDRILNTVKQFLSKADWSEAARKDFSDQISPRIESLDSRVSDELGSFVFFSIKKESVCYFLNQFSKEVQSFLSKVVFDMEEAGKCYALERYPACVFHLMRIIDAILKVTAKHFGVSATNPNWGEVLKGLNATLDKKKKSDPDQARFLSHIIEQITALKLIRNPLDHSDEELPIDSIHAIEKKYTQEEALRHFLQVKQLTATVVAGLQPKGSSS